jgi:hypothetical protein
MGRVLVATEGITVSIMKKKNSEKKYYYKIKFRMKFNSNLNYHISPGYYFNKIKIFKLIIGYWKMIISTRTNIYYSSIFTRVYMCVYTRIKLCSC